MWEIEANTGATTNQDGSDCDKVEKRGRENEGVEIKAGFN